jgi:MFS superfamily sulfate permease-like transporter
LKVILGTLISYLTGLEPKYNLSIVGSIKKGFPTPVVPAISSISSIITSVIVTSIVTFTLTYSLADFFSKKFKNKVNSTQELFALGSSNLFSSFFQSFTSSASLARSCVQYNCGAKTQMTTVFSCLFLVIVLLFVGPLFASLPQACLAAIIVINLKTLFKKILEVQFFWKVNKLEAALFAVTFSAVVILDIDIGLAIGIGFYFIINLAKLTSPYSCCLGHIPGTALYRDTKLYKDAHQLVDIKIVRVQCELNATNASSFRKSIYTLSGVKPQDYLVKRNKIVIQRRKAEMAANPQPSKFKTFLNKILEFFKNLPKRQSAVQKIADSKNAPEPNVFILGEKNLFDDKLIKSMKIKHEKDEDKDKKYKTEINNNNESTDDRDRYRNEYEKNIHESAEGQERKETESQIADEDVVQELPHIINMNVGIAYQKNNKSTGHLSVIRVEDYADDKPEESESSDGFSSSSDEDEEKLATEPLPVSPIHHLIIDCGPINTVDTVGVKTMAQLFNDYNEIGCRVFLADCNGTFFISKMYKNNNKKLKKLF